MREILFRGKATNRIEGRPYRTNYKNGDWVFGLLTDVLNYAGFSEMTNTNGVSGIEVDPETVGQFTGKTARNGVKIFEGDIVKAKVIQNTGSEVRKYTEVYVVAYHPKFCYFYLKREGNNLLFDGNWAYGVFIEEVIGNIHDNPELLTKNSAIDSPLAKP